MERIAWRQAANLHKRKGAKQLHFLQIVWKKSQVKKLEDAGC
jgi:hypothetical protein